MERIMVVQLLLAVFADGYTFQNLLSEGTAARQPIYMKSFPLVKQLVSSSSIEHIIVITSDSSEAPFRKFTKDFPGTLLFETVDFLTTKDLMKKLLNDKIIPLLWKRLNFLVIGKSVELKYTMKRAHQLDVAFGKKSLLRHFSRWILIPTDDKINKSYFKDALFDNINVILTNNSPFTNTYNETGVTLQTLMWESEGRVLREHVQFLKTAKSAFPNVNHGLNGRIVTVAILEWIPFTKKEKNNNGTLTYRGVSGEMLNRLSIIFNFSVQYVEPPDQQWGEELNSSWTGLIGLLQQEEVDMCGVPYAVDMNRKNVMSYSYPFLYIRRSAVYRRPVNTGHSWTVLIACYKWDVYMWGVITLFLVFILFYLFELVYRYWFGTHSALTCPDIAMLTFSVPLHQGQDAHLASVSSKMLLCFWWIFCIVLTAVYTGNLVAFLSVSREFVPFRTIKELAEQNTYQVGSLSGDYIQLMLKASNSSVYQTLWAKVQLTKVSRYVTAEQEMQIHMDRLDTGQYVFILDEISTNLLMRDRCDISKIPDDFGQIYGSFTFQKDSPLSLLFAGELMHMAEYGLISTWFNMWSPKAKTCEEKSLQKQQQLTTGDLISGFAACAVGIFLATICLVAEYVYKCFHK